MALVVKDRVKETTATTGTGTLTLAGAVSGFQAFNSALSNGDTTYYAITEASTGAWEVGLGTFTATSSLARTTIYASSNSGSAINLTAGDAEVFITLPASQTLLENQTITLSGDLSGSGTTSIDAQIASNVVGANELNVSGNGTVGQALTSDGDGTFSWTTITPGISSVVEDTTPQLGGTLDGQLYGIENVDGVYGRSDVNILTLAGATPLQEALGYPGIVNINGVNSGEVNIWGGDSYGVVNLGIDGSKTQSVNIAAQYVTIHGLIYPSAGGTNGQVLTTDGAGNLSFADASGGISLTDLSVSTATASGSGSLSYNNTNGVFTFAPADLSSYLTGNQTITLSGDLSGSGTTSIDAQIASNVVGANELNVSGNGTTSQYLRSDGDGSFTWEQPTLNSLGNAFSDIYNLAIGDTAYSFSFASGAFNTVYGIDSGDSITTGDYNTAVGYNALTSVTTQSNNTAVGAFAMDGTNSQWTTAVGAYAGEWSPGSYVTLIGGYAGRYGTSNDYTVAVGYQAAYSSTSYSDNDYNTWVGGFAGNGIYGGDFNVGLGYQAGYNINNASYSTVVGAFAGYGNSNSYCTFVGNNAGRESDGANNVAIGHNAGYYQDGTGNIAIGYQAMDEASVTGSYNIAIGYDSALSATNVSNEMVIGAAAATTGEITRFRIPGLGIDWTAGTVPTGGGISLTDLSVTTSAASGGGSLSYNNTNGVFTFAPAAVTTYSAGSGLDLVGTTFSVQSDLRDGITHIGLDTTDYITFVNNSQIDFYINGSNEFRMEADGDFHADGDVIAYSTTTASDLRLKKDIVVVENALEKLHKLDGVEFKWKRDDVASAGVIAQQVQEVLPQAVKEVTGLNGENHLTVNYGALTAVLIEAIKELTAKVDSLEIALRDKEGR